ncbi:hypothetical protein [Acetobacter papayae]|uniref:hypothetical protein n=1 Tax=Acetobacter papayae TaxID=1076592 RepID=UPI0039E8F864
MGLMDSPPSGPEEGGVSDLPKKLHGFFDIFLLNVFCIDYTKIFTKRAVVKNVFPAEEKGTQARKLLGCVHGHFRRGYFIILTKHKKWQSVFIYKKLTIIISLSK